MTVTEQKKTLRKVMFQKRSAVDVIIKTEYDKWICIELEKLIVSRGYKVVHSYIPFMTEIDISPLLIKMLELNITVVCPKTLPKRKLENRILNNLQDLETGIMGTKHPARADAYDGNYDMVIVPGLAFDERRYRVGYGGGYYDNFLAANPESYKVGIFYPFQSVASVPIESHDICLDTIMAKPF